MEEMTETAAVAELVRDGQKPELVSMTTARGDKGVGLTLPDGHGKFRPLGVKEYADQYRDHPQRRTGKAVHYTLASLVDHMNRFHHANSAVFADHDPASPSMTAVLDSHDSVNPLDGANGTANDTGNTVPVQVLPQFMAHQAHYAFPLSGEWQAWQQHNGQPITPEERAVKAARRRYDAAMQDRWNNCDINDRQRQKTLEKAERDLNKARHSLRMAEMRQMKGAG